MTDLRRPRRRGNGALEAIASFVIGRSRLVIAIWLAAVCVLGFLGRNLDRELTIRPLYIDGTSSKLAHDIALREFGNDNQMIVLLRGPQAVVKRQGQELADGLEAVPRILVVSPWARGATVEGLNPRPGVAALLVRSDGREGEDVTSLLAPVERQIALAVSGPVRTSIAGFPPIVESLRDAGEEANRIGELIGVPLLLLVLLLVFRSMFAALMPVVVGGAVVVATRGVLSQLLGVVEIDLFASGIVGMMGLALGVDYSLLVVSRFREELEGNDVSTATRLTLIRTARSILPAGCGLLLAMVAAAVVLPGSSAKSISISVMTATVLSMVSALVVVPALLARLGTNIDRFSLPSGRRLGPVPLSWTRRLATSPRAVVAIVIGLLVLSGWAFTLDSGAAGIGLLPSGDAGRRQQEEVQKALGPGWVAPMEVVVDGDGKPVTSTSRLRAIASFQHRLERDPGVATVAGVARVANGAEELGQIEGGLAEQERGLVRLQTGIFRLRRGAAANHEGLSAAAKGSSELESGLKAANSGAGVLSDALDQASAGSSNLAQGLGRVAGGSGQVADGTSKASGGAGRLASALARAREQTGEVTSSATLFDNAMRSGNARLDELHSPLGDTEARLAAAWQALQRMTNGRSDPEYAAALRAVEEAGLRLSGREIASGEQADPDYAGIAAGIERAEGQFDVGTYLASRMAKSGREASVGMRKLAKGAARLDRGLRQLVSGSRKVAEGAGALAGGGRQLSPAMRRLSEGADSLTGGLDLLETGAGRLAGGLGSGATKSEKLTTGLSRVEDGLAGNGGAGLAELRQRSPGLFHSAYFVLAGLDGSRPKRRAQIGTLINLDQGGMNARMFVVPHDEAISTGAEETKDRLEDDAADLARETGMTVAVGGVAPGEIDANEALRSQAPLMRLILSLISFLVLVPVMRSLTMPLLAALINLLTVSASFGILALFFDGSLLGGPGYVDASVIPATIIVMFGLAIDYEVFVFARIREEYVRGGSTRDAVRRGLDRTAHVVTGAGLIMISVFLAFSVSEFMTIRNFGVAQAIAVFIDAFLVRLVVVPATMNWLGEWSWWGPRWLRGSRRPSAHSRAEQAGG
jgi:putative drug exporter of the RND superfamily